MNDSEIPTNFKVIGFGASILSTLESISYCGYDSVSVYDANILKNIIPTDEDKMAIILVTGDLERAIQCAKTFYQAGVLTVAITLEGLFLPDDACDTQSSTKEYKFVEIIKCLLNVIFNYNGYVSLDFSDIDTTLRDSRYFEVISVYGLGESRMEDLTHEVLDYIDDIFANKVDKVIMVLSFNKNVDRPLVMNGIRHLSMYFNTLPKEITALWGLYHNEIITTDSIRVSLILSGQKLAG